ncbi:DUF3899 domain-containing protein [Pseudalkalibacillus caeni]|uniref:DUF3899 domain-containing protein n=1 Tax=Exobacillus caeni TaxID=2574798 RepID=A0A5R9F8G6_9BACL|nr:DUF3899 domain-containing protein [Pseudalkalibacillus caeni]TLS38540.1 DUF3899 domain-containing protein [Pseudalkalibacillus caeni]
MRNFLFITLFVSMLLLVGQKVLNTELLTMINNAFFWGLISLTIGACFYILQTGFLNLFFDGFRQITSVIVPKSRSLERTDRKMKEDVSLKKWKQTVFANAKLVFLGIGSGMALFSITGTFFL